jgi:hypothetical protein
MAEAVLKLMVYDQCVSNFFTETGCEDGSGVVISGIVSVSLVTWSWIHKRVSSRFKCVKKLYVILTEMCSL